MLLLNNQPIKYFTFPGGELQVNVGKITSERAVLTWKPTRSDDIILLIMTVNALKHEGCRDIIIDVLYFPYARQDRVCSRGESFSLEVIVPMIDNLGVQDLRFWDLHNSDLTLDMFKHTFCTEIEIIDTFLHYKFLDQFDLDNLILCAPDNGSCSKIDAIVKEFKLSNAIHFEKDRCPDTGIIRGIKPDRYNRNFDDYNILVVDDICDGGGTFVEVAKQLKEHTQENLYLYVTHGIFSNGLRELLQYYEHIFCHHVLRDNFYQSNEHLTIILEHSHVY